MVKISKDLEPNDAILGINECSTVEDLSAFIEGEARELVLAASDARNKELAPPPEGKGLDFASGKEGDAPTETTEPKSAKIAKDYSNAKDANVDLMKLDTEEAVNAFIEGDTRKTVKEAAAKHIKKLTAPKVGRTEEIGQKTEDFKDGITGEKSVTTCADILPSLREKGMKI
jgi:hypothetical protein